MRKIAAGRLGAALAICLLNFLSAQPAPAPGPDSAAQKTETVVELSPFLVTAEAETGYRATATLAGTRLKTDLKDIGAAVSVVTDEMMRDLGAVRIPPEKARAENRVRPWALGFWRARDASAGGVLAPKWRPSG